VGYDQGNTECANVCFTHCSRASNQNVIRNAADVSGAHR